MPFRKGKPEGKTSRKTARKKAPGRGALWIVAMLFLMSGVVRLGDHGVAIAEEVSSLVSAASDTGNADAMCEADEDIVQVLAVLREREQAVMQREEQLENRLHALKAAEQQIDRKMQELLNAEQQLKSTMALADGAAEKDLEQLTQVYENMKPKQAIPLFAQMDPQFAAGFLGRMRSEVAAQIMAGLEPQKSYAISVILAGRNSNVPTN